MRSLLPFDATTADSACHELDSWQRRLGWRDWHGRAWSGRLRRDAEAEAVAASTRMEGVRVTVMEVRRILAGDPPPGVEPSAARLVEGYRDAVRFALGRADDPAFRWNGELLIGLQDRILAGDHGLGAGRIADRARWIGVSGSDEVLFHPPPPAAVPALVDEMCERLNAGGLHPALAAAWAHAATAAIHPFGDGNGRTARVLATLAMYRGGFRLWAFTTLESWWGDHRADYYDAFRCLGRRFDAAADVTPFVLTHVHAQLSQVRALDLRERVEHRIWDAIVTAVEDAGLEERAANAVWEAFFERDTTAGYYRGLTDVSPATATNDLRALVAAGLLSGRGQRRARRYLAGPRLHACIGAHLDIEGAPDRRVIAGVLAERLAHERRGGDGGLTMADGALRRRVDVRHLAALRDSVLDCDITVRDDGQLVARTRASLSPEAWSALGRMLGHDPWPPPGDVPAGDAGAVADAFVDVVVEVVTTRPSASEVRIGAEDTDLLGRIAARSRDRAA